MAGTRSGSSGRVRVDLNPKLGALPGQFADGYKPEQDLRREGS